MNKKVLLLCTLFATGSHLHSQNSARADSLLQYLQANPTRDSNRVLILNQLAFNFYTNNAVRSLAYGFEARQIADSLHFAQGEADALRQIGIAFWAQGDMVTATSYLFTGLSIAEKNHLDQVQADIIGNIGTAYNGMGNSKDALDFLLRARSMQQQLKNYWREASVLNNLGDTYLALKDFDNAKKSYSVALEIASRNNYPLGVSTNLRNLGNILEAKGEYDSALANYFRCVELSSGIKDNRGLILCYKSISSVYLKTRKIKEAKEFGQKALGHAISLNLKAFIRDSYEQLARIYEVEGSKDLAFEMFKKYITYRDSVQNLRIVSEIAANRLRYETERKQSEIELLKTEGELRQAQIQFQNSQITIISVSLLISLGFLTMAIINFRKMKDRNKLLESSQQEIKNQNRLLEKQSEAMRVLNVELQSQQEQVMKQRDELFEKNYEIELANKKVLEVNQNLEKLVSLRTQVLLDQNKRLMEYSYFNAHQLRSPVASILGLVNLLQHTSTPQEHLELMKNLEITAQRLDKAIRSINESLQQGIHKEE